MIVRLAIVTIAVGLLAVQVVRNAAVGMLSERSPARIQHIWASHPSVEISSAMTGIAEAARDRRPVSAPLFTALADAAAKDPLAPEPFLATGVRAQLAGDSMRARRAFEAAQWRDPRSLAAAYFLAEHYLRTGDRDKGLMEVAALARLAPGGIVTVAPYLAAYARDPANWPALRKLFRDNPSLAQVTLTSLAASATTAPAVLALADPRADLRKAEWFVPLLNTMTAAGLYRQAFQLWTKAAGSRSAELVHDLSFKDTQAPPPFNWSLTGSPVGLAERQRGGRLHVVFYGQEDGTLAEQLVLLQPGSYRLSMRLQGDPARAKTLSWSIWCDKAPTPLSAATLDVTATRGWQFQVPQTCAAQRLRLAGSSSDISQQVDVTIASLKLEKAQ